ncbi:tRNA 2-thiouridine(34) synthase MnmA [Candidatus Legionella polyplacis]|uniref:tRNA-specific 2-thiouridylase MnmA n=1 Tax=Candidatus Legionella polyplacis TaxID=2005262 RepID=A0ABZ2GZ61_9GAMM
MKAKVIVAMSGGVDSSVAAWMLKKQKYLVEGLFVKNWEKDDILGKCAFENDWNDAKLICKQLNIPIHYANFSEEYWEKVFKLFINEYEQGKIPNPDIICNKEIKFKIILKYSMLKLGADFLATGHYAKISYKKQLYNNSPLFQAKDKKRDQTYFLHAINPKIFKYLLFPLGDHYKMDVRKLAKKLGFTNYNKKSSTGLCFIGKKNFKNFLQEFFLLKPGFIKNVNGKILGKHDGVFFYTIGQRKGLGIGGKKNADQLPWYVQHKNIKTNTLIVVQGINNFLLYSKNIYCEPIHWLLKPFKFPFNCFAKIRHGYNQELCTVFECNDSLDYYIEFYYLQRAINPGQYIVFYKNNQCLGGAKIKYVIH